MHGIVNAYLLEEIFMYKIVMFLYYVYVFRNYCYLIINITPLGLILKHFQTNRNVYDYYYYV